MIRLIRPEDRAQYIALAHEFYRSPAVHEPVPDSHFEATFDELMRSDVYTACYVVEEDQKLVAYMLLSRAFSQEAGGMVTWIEELYVKPEYRKRGISRALFDLLDKRDSESTRWRLEVTSENEAAKRLYKKLGFTKTPYEQMMAGQ